jgi:molybdenum cofactor cytidylyltransferase
MPKPLLRFPRRASVPARLFGRAWTVPDVSCGDARPTKSDDTTFLEQIVSVLQRSEVDRITVVLGAQAQKVLASTDLSGADVVINENYREGQLSSLIAGLKSVPPETEVILLCLVDNPFIAAESAGGVIGAFRVSGKSIVVPVFQGRRGHPTLFARSMFDELRSAPADKGARHVVRSNVAKVFEVEVPDPGILVRIDTPRDYLSHFGVAPQIIER